MHFDHDVEVLVAAGAPGIKLWLLFGLSLIGFAAALGMGVI